MKKFYAAMLIAMAVISLSACKKVTGVGPVVSESRTTADFSSIEFEVPGKIRYIKSETREIVIEAQQNIIDLIETRVRSENLRIFVRNNYNLKSHEEILITVRSPYIHSIAMKGSGDLDIPGIFNPENGHLSISGSGNITVNAVENKKLDIRIAGSGNVDILDGEVEHTQLSISGSGNINMLGVESAKVTSNTSGSGTIRVSVSELLDAKISGSGDVYYTGSPVVNADISGSGKVRKL